jgi:hypothetical protein
VTGRPATLRTDSVRGALAAASLAAAGIHAGVAGGHVREGVAFGVFFAAVAFLQAAWSVGIVVRPSRSLGAIGVVGSAGLIFLWVASRTVGLPFGVDRWTPEAIGLADILATACEVLIVVGVIRRLRAGWQTGSAPRSAISRSAMRCACVLAPATVGALIASGHQDGGVTAAHHPHMIVLSAACVVYSAYLALRGWSNGGYRFTWRLSPGDPRGPEPGIERGSNLSLSTGDLAAVGP